MSGLLKHIFASLKGDGGDATLIQPSNWNDFHKFSGGANGNLLQRDTSDATYGASWTAGPITGPWTPIIGGLSGTSGQTYSSQVGRYFKFGKLVLANGFVGLTAKGTITGGVVIGGLPFTSENVTNGYAVSSIAYFQGMATNWVSLGAYVNTNDTQAILHGVQAAAASTVGLTAADIGNTTQMMVTFLYQAAS